MNLYIIAYSILIISVLVGLSVSLYQIISAILGVMTMTLSGEQKKIEIRRNVLIISLFSFTVVFTSRCVFQF